MKLIFLFVLGLLINVFKSEEYVLKGQLTKYNVVTLSSNYRLTYYFAYLDTRDFPDEDEIGLKVTVYDGDLVNTEMWYEGYENVSSQSVLKSRKSYYSSTSSSSYGRTYYDEITYYYKIPKPSKRYLYVSTPYFDGYSYSSAELMVGETSIEIGIIVAIVIAVVVFIVATIIIVVYCVRKARRRNLINPELGYAPQINTYANQPPVAPIYPPAAPYSPPVDNAYPSPNYY